MSKEAIIKIFEAVKDSSRQYMTYLSDIITDIYLSIYPRR